VARAHTGGGSVTLVVRTDHEAVVELRLNRPEQRNALSTPLLAELRDHLAAVQADPGVRVVLLTAAGPAFSAGADIRELGPDAPAPKRLARTRLLVEVLRRLGELEQPSLAAVHGPAVGGGWGIALACDLCFAATEASFSLPEVAKGFRLPALLVTRLAQVVGPVRAAEIVLGASTYGVDEALRAGWVTRVFDGVQALHEEAWAFAAALASRPLRALAAAKNPLRQTAVAAPFPPPELMWTEE
jgi:enoyl-CoA hydratase/carnithine racemase